ncbi:MAG: hypothetical protein BWY15_02405 [Firmicutes bacterium ADurb.Bin193]|nr:MAG: hypothetical protein BWY15_02405 [Firmicutes bacterium ADurb.Bin193]
MSMNKILNADTLHDLIDAINDFCRESYTTDIESICIELKEKVASAKNNDILMLLDSYLSSADDGDEVIDSLYEFVGNCKGFVEADEETTAKVTKEEFETVLNECEEKCGLKTCIEKEHALHVAETDLYNEYREFSIKHKNNNINIILPRINNKIDVKQYIAEELGAVLYNVLTTKLAPEYIEAEMNRYIPETIQKTASTSILFKQYFYDVVLYKDRKPGIYTEFDEHMERVLNMEFFKRIIVKYLKE